MIERCIYQKRDESISEARLDIARWFKFYNMERPHQALKMKTINERYRELVA
jgi:putative transposase